MHRSGSNSVKGDRETSTKLEPLLQPAGADTGCVDANGPKQSLDFAGPLITETPKLQAVSANTGGKFLHLGLKDQTTKFAEQVLPFRRSSLPTSIVSTSPQPFLVSSLTTHSMTASLLRKSRSSQSSAAQTRISPLPQRREHRALVCG